MHAADEPGGCAAAALRRHVRRPRFHSACPAGLRSHTTCAVPRSPRSDLYIRQERAVLEGALDCLQQVMAAVDERRSTPLLRH